MRQYDMHKIQSLLARVQSEIGPERFAAMKLLELEKVVRTHDASHELPGKTLLREAIHIFRRGGRQMLHRKM